MWRKSLDVIHCSPLQCQLHQRSPYPRSIFIASATPAHANDNIGEVGNIAHDKVVISYQIIKALIDLCHINGLSIAQRRHTLFDKAMHIPNARIERLDVWRIIKANLDPWHLIAINGVAVNSHVKVGEYW